MPAGTHPQSLVQLSPLGTPAQSAQKVLSPSHSPHSSSTFPAQSHSPSGIISSPPHMPEQSNIFPAQSHSPSSMPSPPHSPHSSTTAEPPHIPAQSSSYAQLPLSTVAFES